MTAATSTPTTAPPSRPTAPPGLRSRLDPTMAGRGAVDGGWWPWSRDPDAELPELIAKGSSLGPTTRMRSTCTPGPVMAMAADAANSAGPADILAAAGVRGEDRALTRLQPLR
jgi:hypothetical protein